MATGSEVFKLLGCLGLVLEKVTSKITKDRGRRFALKHTTPNEGLEVTSGRQDVPISVVVLRLPEGKSLLMH